MVVSKKAIWASIAFVIVGATTSAQELTRIERPSNAPATAKELVQEIRARGAGRLGRISPNVISSETSDSGFIIPAAGNLAGANGTFFRSDLSLANLRGVDQRIGISFLQSGTDNSSAPVLYFNLPANSVVSYGDFVGQQMKTSGLGGLLVGAVTATGAGDENGLINGFSRIWTPQPGSVNGTVSQSFPAVSVFDSFGPSVAYALGLRQDANFRTNAGVVNLDSASHTFTVQALTGVKTTVTVLPFSLAQVGIPAGSANSGGYVTLLISPNDTAGFLWSAYGTTVDNTTGDGWVSRATQ